MIIVRDCRCLKNDVIGFTETQMKPSDSISIVDDTLKNFYMNFNNNNDKFLSWAYGSQDGIAIIKKFDINVMSIISLKKDNFTDCIFILMLVYQKRQCHKMKLVKCWVFILLVANSVDVIVGYFKYDLWKV